MRVDFSAIGELERYKLMSQSIIPRPIAWIVTEYEGIVNIAPFSYFTALSSDPATLIVSIGHKSDDTPKDTLRNIRRTQRCTICIAHPSQLQYLHDTSAELEAHISEASFFGIETQKIDDAFPPMIKNVQIAYFCTLYQELTLGKSETIPLILEIKQMHIDDKVIKNAQKFHIEVEPIARIGKSYAQIGEKITPIQRTPHE